MVDFIDEVNEDLKRERFEAAWRKLGGYVLGASVLVILATAASVLWKNHQKTTHETQTVLFLSAEEKMKAKNWGDAVATFGEVARSQADGIARIAALEQAIALRKMGKLPEAEKIYVDVANATKDAAIASLARISAAQIMMQEKKPYNDINAILQPIMDDDRNPFLTFAKEQLAYAAYGAGDEVTAKRLMGELMAAKDTPASIRMRAEQIMGASR